MARKLPPGLGWSQEQVRSLKAFMHQREAMSLCFWQHVNFVSSLPFVDGMLDKVRSFLCASPPADMLCPECIRGSAPQGPHECADELLTRC